MTRRKYPIISDAEMRKLQAMISGWAAVEFGRNGFGATYARAAVDWLSHGMEMKIPANRESAVLRAWEYFRAACNHLTSRP